MKKPTKKRGGVVDPWRPQNEVLRELLTAKIVSVTRAEAAMRNGEEDALHRFRVALRRLRALLRGYRREFDPGSKIRSQLKRLSASTNLARDQEVLVLWINSQQSLLAIPPLTLEAIVAELRGKEASESDVGVDYPAVEKNWQRLSRRLHSRLSLSLKQQFPGFNVATCEVIQRVGEELQEQLEKTGGPKGIAALHAARIVGKRLRYTLEPLQGTVPPVDSALVLLASLQEELGLCNDRAVFVQRLRQQYKQVRRQETDWLLIKAIELEGAPSQGIELSDAILRLIEQAAAEQRLLIKQFQADWQTRTLALQVVIDDVTAFLLADRRQ